MESSIQRAGHLLKPHDLKHGEVGQRRQNGKAAGRSDVVATGKGNTK
jgi:hypothetical protein